jgi:hypothetical protein
MEPQPTSTQSGNYCPTCGHRNPLARIKCEKCQSKLSLPEELVDTSSIETIPAQPRTDRRWYEIWWDVWRHPGTVTFRSILQEPAAKAERGFIWVAVMAFIGSVISSLSSMIFLRNIAPTIISGSVTSLICGAISAPIVAVIGLAISAGIYHLIAKLFGGNGDWGQLAYSFAAIQAPLYLLTFFFSFLYSVVLGSLLTQPTAALAQQLSTYSICLALPSLALSIYLLVLFVCAIQAVENIGTGRSVLTYFVPVIIVFVLMVCFVLFLLVPVLSTTR